MASSTCPPTAAAAAAAALAAPAANAAADAVEERRRLELRGGSVSTCCCCCCCCFMLVKGVSERGAVNLAMLDCWVRRCMDPRDRHLSAAGGRAGHGRSVGWGAGGRG